jgi:hypothetical protein
MLDTFIAVVAVGAFFVGPLVALAYTAIVFGADSHPDIANRDRRTWLWRGPFD